MAPDLTPAPAPAHLSPEAAPAHLSSEARRVWEETCTPEHTPEMAVLLEAYCVQVARMRDAQGRIDAEGLIIDGPRGLPLAHPALTIEHAASREVSRLAAAISDALRRPVHPSARRR